MEAWTGADQFVPVNGTPCWVSDGSAVWFAYREVTAAGGWENGDTWEDFEKKVTHWIALTEPDAPIGGNG